MTNVFSLGAIIAFLRSLMPKATHQGVFYFGQSNFVINGDLVDDHVRSFGCTRKGKTTLFEGERSPYLHRFAVGENVPYEQLERIFLPSYPHIDEIAKAYKKEMDDHLQAERESQIRIHIENQERKINAVKSAYWSQITIDEIAELHSMIEGALDLDVTTDKIKVVYDNLPSSIIGNIVAHGFADTLVREGIYDYLNHHSEEIVILIISQ